MRLQPLTGDLEIESFSEKDVIAIGKKKSEGFWRDKSGQKSNAHGLDHEIEWNTTL